MKNIKQVLKTVRESLKEYIDEQLKNYAKTTDVPTKVSQLLNDSAYLKSVPPEYVTESELTAKGYTTQSYVDDNEIVTTFYGTSESLATDSEKIITVEDPKFVLRVGTIISTKFSVSNSASNVTLNVNGTGAYPIWYSTSQYTGTSGTYCGTANRPITYMFNGTHWIWLSASAYTSSASNPALGHGYGVCDTDESTVAKAVTISSYTLVVGGIVAIKFTYGVPANATLNIRTRGAKKIFYKGSAITDGVIKAGDTVTLIYDGTQYHVISIDRPIPSKTSELTNDSGFVTQSYVDEKLTQDAPIVSSVDEMIDENQIYVLESTNTVWRYKGVKIPAGEVANFNNILDDEGVEIILNKRINSSNALVDAQGMAVIGVPKSTGLIGSLSTVDPCWLRTKGCSMAESSRINDSAGKQGYYAGDGTKTAGASPHSQWIIYVEENGTMNTLKHSDTRITETIIQATKLGYLNSTVGDDSTNKLDTSRINQMKQYGFWITILVTLNGKNITATEDDLKKCIMTINEPITYTQQEEQMVYQWVDTGLPYSGDNSDVVVELADEINTIKSDVSSVNTQVNSLRTQVNSLDQRVTDIEENGVATSTTSSELPKYWKDYIDTFDDKIIALQDEGGVDTLQFLWCSDVHGVTGATNTGNQAGHGKSSQKNIGNVGRYCMDKYNIPFFAITGDIMSQASHTSEQGMWNEYENLKPILAPIKAEERFFIRGNHDGCWGSPVDINGDGTQDYYTKTMGAEKIFRAIYKIPSMDRTKIFGGDGMYYYVNVGKYRIYMLNTHSFGDDSADENGYAIYNGFKHPAFGTEQLQWIADTLMTVRDDQYVVMMAHAPIANAKDQNVFCDMINAYKNRTKVNSSKALSGAFWGWDGNDTSEYMTSQVNADFTNAKGQMVAWFNGHIHNDAVDTTGYSFPAISITTAGADVRDSNYYCERVPDTYTETAIDLVTINPKKITMTRLGAGRDRIIDLATKEVTYGELPEIVEPEQPTLTQGNITSEVGYSVGKVFAGGINDGYDSMSFSSNNLYACTGVIDVVPNDVIRIKGMTWETSASSSGIAMYSDDKAKVWKVRGVYNGCANTTGVTFNFPSTDLIEITITNDMLYNSSSAGSFVGKAIQICGKHDGTTPIVITRNSTDMSGGSSSGGGNTPSIDANVPTNLISTDVSTYTLNKKYSGTSIVDGNSYYLSEVTPVDLTKQPYLHINGLYISGSSAPIEGDYLLYKIGFYQDGVIKTVEYTNNLGFIADNKGQQTIQLPSTYEKYNGMQLSFLKSQSTDTAINTSDIVVNGEVSAVLSNSSTWVGSSVTLTQGEITSEVTWTADTRLSSSTGDYSSQQGISSSSDIAVQQGDIIRVYGMTSWKYYPYINLYNASGTLMKNCDLGNASSLTNGGGMYLTLNGTDLVIEITSENASFIRICNATTEISSARIFRNAELGSGGSSSTLTQGEITSEVTWTSGMRISSSSGGDSTSDATNVSTSSYIELNKGDTIRFYGIIKYAYHSYVAVYDANKNCLKDVIVISNNADSNEYSNNYCTVTKGEGILEITATSDSVAYMRLCNSTDHTISARVYRNAELELGTLPNGDITSEVGYTLDKRYSTSGGVIKDANTHTPMPLVLDKILMQPNDVIRVKGLTYPTSSADPCICLYSETNPDSYVAGRNLCHNNSGSEVGATSVTFTIEDDLLTVTNNSTISYYVGLGGYYGTDGTVHYRVTRNDANIDINNLAVPSATNTTDQTRWINGYRITGNYALESNTSQCVSNTIPISNGDVIRISGVTLTEGTHRVMTTHTSLNADDYGQDVNNGGYFQNGSYYINYNGLTDGVYKFTVINDSAGALKSFRFSMPNDVDRSKVRVTVNEYE